MSRKIIEKPSTEEFEALPGKSNDGKLLSCCLYKVDAVTGNIITDVRGKFLLNPASFNENKTANWATQQIPGNSDPVYQYMGGGPRTVTFDTLVTRDTSHLDSAEEDNPLQDLAGAAFTAVGAVASAFAGVTLPPITDLFGSLASGKDRLSISNRLAYYRSLLYPLYTTNYAGLVQSPSLVVLLAGASFTDAELTKTSSVLNKNSGETYTPVWIVTNLNIRITKQLPNLDPMEAIVSFTLNEYTTAPTSANSLNQLSGVKKTGGFEIFGLSL